MQKTALHKRLPCTWTGFPGTVDLAPKTQNKKQSGAIHPSKWLVRSGATVLPTPPDFIPPDGQGALAIPLADEWTEVRSRKRHRVMQTKAGAVTGESSIEERRVVVWCNEPPPTVDWIYNHYISRLPAYIANEVTRVAVMRASLRFDLIMSSTDARELILRYLVAERILPSGHRARRGETFSQRKARRQPEETQGDDNETHLHCDENPYLPLATADEAEENQLRTTPQQSRDNQHSAYKHVRFGSLNADGFWPFGFATFNSLKHYNLDFISLQETYQPSDKLPPTLEGYTYFGCPLSEGSRRGKLLSKDNHGVAILVRDQFVRAVSVIPTHFKDLLVCRVIPESIRVPYVASNGNLLHAQISLPHMWIFTVYLSPNLPVRILRKALDEMETNIVRAKSEGAVPILLGDFNEELFGGLKPREEAGRGHKAAFAARNALQPSHKHVAEPGPTCYPHSGAKPSLLDYCLVPESIVDYMKHRVSKEDFHSDHRLIKITWADAVSWGGDSPRGMPAADRPSPPPVHLGFKTEMLKEPLSPALVETLQRQKLPINAETPRTEALRLKLEQADFDQDADARSFYGLVMNELMLQAETIVGRRKPNEKKRSFPPWVTPAVWDAIKKRRVAFRRLGRVAYESEEYLIRLTALRKARRNADRALCESRAEHFKSLRRQIVEADSPQQVWPLVRKLTGRGFKAQPWGVITDDTGRNVAPSDPCYVEVWGDYYRKLGTPDVVIEATPELTIEWNKIVERASSAALWADPVDPSSVLSEANSPFTVEELDEALSSQKPTAFGADGIDIHVLRILPREVLLAVYNKLWQEEVALNEWGLALIVALHKGGEATPTNSRGISLLSVAMKVMDRLILARMHKVLNENKSISPAQAGFRPGRECVEQSFILHETLSARKDQAKLSYVIFIDLRKAYDLVWREALWVRLHDAGIQGKMLRMMKAMYEDTGAAVRMNGQVSGRFPIEIGLKQGGVLSPMQFDVFIDPLIQALEAADVGVTVGTRSLFDRTPEQLAGLLFADDIALVVDGTEEKLRKALDVVSWWCNVSKMQAGHPKCGLMVVAPDEEQEDAWQAMCRSHERSPYLLQGKPIPLVKQYEYLGNIFEDGLKWDIEIEARVKKTEAAVKSILPFLKTRSVPQTVRLSVAKAIAWPTLCWGIALWAPPRYKLESLESKVFKEPLAAVLTGGKGLRTSWLMLMAEAGISPLEQIVASQKARLWLKWRYVSKEDPEQFKWIRHAMAARSGTKSWVSMTISLLKRRGIEAPRNPAIRTARVPSDWRRLSSTASSQRILERLNLAWSSSAARQQYVALRRGEALPGHDVCPQRPVQYLSVGGSSMGSEVLYMLRTGSLPTMEKLSRLLVSQHTKHTSVQKSRNELSRNDVVQDRSSSVHWPRAGTPPASPPTSSDSSEASGSDSEADGFLWKCALCGEKEDDMHFLLYCEGLADLRTAWLNRWAEVPSFKALLPVRYQSGDTGGDISYEGTEAFRLRVLDEYPSCLVKDSIAPEPGGSRSVVPDIDLELLRVRTEALGAMWSRRCERLSHGSHSSGAEVS